MRILIVQTSFPGDVMLSTPVVSALRALHPSAEIWMMTTPQARGLVQRDPELAGVLTFDKNGDERSIVALFAKARQLKAKNFDCVYALQRSARTTLLLWLARIPQRIGFSNAKLSWLYHSRFDRDKSKHDVERNLQILGDAIAAAPPFDSKLRLALPRDSEISPFIQEALSKAGNQPTVLVPGSVWPTKRWDWRGYRDLSRRLVAAGKQVIIVGSASERELCERVSGNLPVTNLAGRTTVDELTWVISRAKVVICNDSLALHLASAAQIPTVAIFCATSPKFGFGPWKNVAKVLEVSGLDCKPCTRHGGAACPTGTWACMRKLDPSRVFAAAQELTI